MAEDSSNVVYILRPYLKVDGGTSLGTCTITTNWTLNETTKLYTQNVALSTVTEESNPMIKCTASSDSSEYNKLIAATAYDGGITFVATAKTTRNLTVEIINWTDKLILTNMFVNDFSLGTELDALTSKVNANVSALTKIQGSISTKTIYAATLLADSWTPSDGYYTQTVTVTGVTADSTPIVDITAGELSNADFVKVQTAWSKALKATTAANALTVVATDEPTVDIPIQIMDFKAGA